MHGLDPNRTYRYRFCFRRHTACSATGRFRPRRAPRSRRRSVRILGGRDGRSRRQVTATPFWGRMKAFKTMAGEHNDFNIDFGDTIYSDPEVPARRPRDR